MSAIKFKNKYKRQGFFHGAVILASSAFIVKIIGLFFKVPLTSLLGGEGMGYFSSAFTVYVSVFLLSVAGLPVAVSRMVAENASLGRYRDIRRIMKLSATAFTLTGAFGSILMLILSKQISLLIKNPNAVYSIMVMSPAVFFGCLIACLRGYYEGLRNMYPTAISQIIEAMGRLVLGYGSAAFIMKWALDSYNMNGTVFGQPADNLAQAQRAALPFAAAGGIAGITLGSVAGFIYLFAYKRLRGDGITKSELAYSPAPARKRYIARQLVKIALPVSLGTLIMNITSLIDLSTLLDRLNNAITSDTEAFMLGLGKLLPEGIRLNEIPNYLYGAYTGMAVTIYTFVPGITSTFGISALPVITSSWASRNIELTRRNIESVLKMTFLIGCPAGISMSVLSKPILSLIFANRTSEVEIAAPLLSILGIAVIFVALCGPINGIFQALGRADLPVKIMVAAAILKLAVNFTLVSMPTVNIKGAPIGSIVCFSFTVISSIFILYKTFSISLDIKNIFIKPLFASAACGATAYVSYGMLERIINTRTATLLAIVFACVMYTIFLGLLRIITKNDIKLLPKGTNISKLLEKLKIIV